MSSGGLAAAVITLIEQEKCTWVELYDSSATRHISPFHDDFSSYHLLDPPLFLNAANGQQFPAVGTGSIIICVPNDGGQSKLMLQDVLHVPSVGYTLVSLGALDGLSYHIAIGGGHLEILSCAGECLACIVRSVCGLYHVLHEEDGGYAVEVVSVMELHRWRGILPPLTLGSLWRMAS